MPEHPREPSLAPGQELTLHPGDPVRGAELLQDASRRHDTDMGAMDGKDNAGELLADQDEESDPGVRRAAPEVTINRHQDGASGAGRPALGAVTQDDPMAHGLGSYPTTGAEGDLTLVAVFEDITGAESCARDLERRGIEVGLVQRRGDGPEQGLRPGNVITGPGYGLSAEDQSPPRNPAMGAGVTVGATIGATVGWLATNYVLPGFGPVIATGGLISTLAGAGLGAFLGGLTEFGTSEQQDGDDATLYAGQVRRGGVLLLARVDAASADEVRRAIDFWRPLEIRVQ